MEDMRKTWPTVSTKQCSVGLTEIEVASMGPVCICTRFSVYTSWLLVWCFHGNPNRGSGCVSDSFAFS